MGFGEGMMKVAVSKALVIKINLAFLALFLVVYLALLLQPPSLYAGGGTAATLVRCSLRDCHKTHKGKVSSNPNTSPYHLQLASNPETLKQPTPQVVAANVPSFIDRLHARRIALVNVREEEAAGWGSGEAVAVEFERVSASMEWKDLYPEWVDEEEENEGPACPELAMPDYEAYGEVDVVVARAPCEARDPFRLQVHLAAAGMAARRGRRDRRGRVAVAVAAGAGAGDCRPMMEVFRCDDLVGREEGWWVYEVDVAWLEEKLRLPVGSCKLALPLWREGTNEPYDPSKLAAAATTPSTGRREAYATVLHSSDLYVCGAIALAQSILATGTTRDLVLLHDKSIPAPKLAALAAAGWHLRLIKRIRNPRAERNSYNEYNYSKLRLWQLTQYRKLIFIDADILVLRSLDVLFRFPQISAVGNDGVIFNSGVMVVEPSSCTFKALMARRKDVVSYNGGDQGFLNEIFVWWHRMPRRVNFLKNFWSNKTAEFAIKNAMFASEPPELYSIHYLGLKPWVCYRDYDCNWDLDDHRVYASDAAHRRWWAVHDGMGEGLQGFCGLSAARKKRLEEERKRAGEMGIGEGRWRIEIKDKRKDQ